MTRINCLFVGGPFDGGWLEIDETLPSIDVGDDNDAADAVALFSYCAHKLYPQQAVQLPPLGALFEAAG